MTGAVFQLSRLAAADLSVRFTEFGNLLHACVHEGASVGFVLPLARAEAEGFWRERVIPGLRAGNRALVAAFADNRLVGSVQLAWDTPPNQPHRADVTKLLVHPEHRRRGAARALLAELERVARLQGRTLLTLDTVTDSAAYPLYLSLGYRVAGEIPDYALAPAGDRLEPTTVMYKAL